MVLKGFCFQECCGWLIVAISVVVVVVAAAAIIIIILMVVVVVAIFLYSKVCFQSNELAKSVEGLLLLKGYFLHYFLLMLLLPSYTHTHTHT